MTNHTVDNIPLQNLSLDELAVKFRKLEWQSQLLRGQILLEISYRFHSNIAFIEWVSVRFPKLNNAKVTRLTDLAKFFQGNRSLEGISVEAGFLLAAVKNPTIAEKVYDEIKGKYLSLDEIKKVIAHYRKAASLYQKDIENSWENYPPLCENFDWESYVDYYQDIKDFGINNKEDAIEHWIKFGQMQGRRYFRKKDLDSGIDISTESLNSEFKLEPIFDYRFYSKKNGLAEDNIEQAYKHYLKFNNIKRKEINIEEISFIQEINFIEEFINNKQRSTNYIDNYYDKINNNIITIENASAIYSKSANKFLAEKDGKIINLSNKLLNCLIDHCYGRYKSEKPYYIDIIALYYRLLETEIYKTIDEECFLGSDIFTLYWGHAFEDIYNFLYTYLKNNLKCKFVIINEKVNQLEFIRNFIPEDNILILENDKRYNFKNIILCKPYHGFYQEYNKESIEYLNNIIYDKLPILDIYPRKIFLVKTNKNSSSGRGVFRNIQELIDELKHRGYFILFPEKYSFNIIINLMRNAQVIVNQWGSSVYHNIYLKPGSTNICLAHKLYRNEYIHKTHLFYNLANYLKINFITLLDLDDQIDIDRIVEDIGQIEKQIQL